MFYGLLYMVMTEFENFGRVWVISGNWPCYTAKEIPVVMPIISSYHGLKMEGLYHPESQNGKILTDYHFEIAMRHVPNYVNEIYQSIIVSSDLISSPFNGGGISGSCVDRFQEYVPFPDERQYFLRK